MRLDIIDNFACLERMEREWSSFAESIEGLTPFQLPAWLLSWWRHFGSGHLHVLVFRATGEIRAIVPCFRHEWEGRRQLTLIGSGISDYLEPPIAQQHRTAVIKELRAHLIEDSDWDVCSWQDLSHDTPIRELAPVCEDTPCSEIKLCGNFDDFWAQRSKDLRRNLRRYTERAERSGSLDFAVTRAADDELMDELIRLHSDRWQARGEAGMIAVNESADFLRKAANEFERLNMLRFFSLRFAGEVVAASVGFLHRNTLYSYLSAFDPRYEILGFGRKLLYESLRYAYGQRYRAWNFCRGEEAYKFSFGAERIPKCRLVVTRAGLDRS